jgi:hypothetical protein
MKLYKERERERENSKKACNISENSQDIFILASVKWKDSTDPKNVCLDSTSSNEH